MLGPRLGRFRVSAAEQQLYQQWSGAAFESEGAHMHPAGSAS